MSPTPCPPLADLLRRYDAFFFDAYGVLVNQSGPLPGATALIATLLAQGTPTYLLTNDASRTLARITARMNELGFGLDAIQIVSAGDMLSAYLVEQQLAGTPCLLLGTADSAQYVTATGGRCSALDEPTSVVIVADDSGYDWRATFNVALNHLIASVTSGRNTHLIVPNVDELYPVGTDSAGNYTFAIAAGSLGRLLESAVRARVGTPNNLHVAYLGKPHAPMFDEAMRRAGTRNAVMFGDQLATDIAGAQTVGIDSILLGTGVTNTTELATNTVQPTYALESFAEFI